MAGLVTSMHKNEVLPFQNIVVAVSPMGKGNVVDDVGLVADKDKAVGMVSNVYGIDGGLNGLPKEVTKGDDEKAAKVQNVDVVQENIRKVVRLIDNHEMYSNFGQIDINAAT